MENGFFGKLRTGILEVLSHNLKMIFGSARYPLSAFAELLAARTFRVISRYTKRIHHDTSRNYPPDDFQSASTV
jgi:hypothetical protein